MQRPPVSQRPVRNVALAFVFALGVLYVALSAWLAFTLRPSPHSDWALYWYSAGNLSAYERGGVGWWLLSVPKSLGLEPATAALLLNLVAGVVVLYLAWRTDRGRYRLRALLTGAYLCLLAPFAGIVQLDLAAACFVALAFAFATWAASSPAGRRLWWLAGACLAAGVSTKPQYALLAWTMALLLAVPAWYWRRQSPWAASFVLMLVAGSLLGFGFDQAHRLSGERSEALRTSSAVTLYAGLLVSPARQEPRARPCGYWTPEAAEAAREDLGKSLPVAIADRLAGRPVSHWFAVMKCKLPEVLAPPPFALRWMLMSPAVESRVSTAGPHWQDRLQTALKHERLLYSVTCLLVLVGLAMAAVQAWRRGQRFGALLPLAWVAAFWSVHLVFEIQGRYFLGLFLLAPLAAALAPRQQGGGAGRIGGLPTMSGVP